MNLYKTACVQQLLFNLSKSFFFFLWLVTALSMLPVPHHLSTYIYSLYVRLAATFRDDRSSCRMCSSACVAGRWRPLLQLDAEHQSYRRERRLHGRRTRRHGDLHRDEPWIPVELCCHLLILLRPRDLPSTMSTCVCLRTSRKVWRLTCIWAINVTRACLHSAVPIG